MPFSSLTDEEIVRKLRELFQKSNETAETGYFKELFRRYSSQAFSLARYFGLRKEDARDTVQEAFLRLYEKIHYIDPNRPFKPYFFRIVSNLTKNKFRELHRKKSLPLDDSFENLPSPGNFEEEMEKRDHIQCMIQKIPDKYRQVFVLKVYGFLNPPEIAKTLRISLQSVYYQLEKGMDILKEIGGGSL